MSRVGAFSQIYIQVVFAVKGRQNLIHASWEDELYKYITGTLRNKDQKLLAINGMPDHIHFLIGMKPSCCLSDLVREVKKHLMNLSMSASFCGRIFIGRKGMVHSPIAIEI